MYKNKYLSWVVATGFVLSFAVILPAFAQGTPIGRNVGRGSRGNGMMSGVFGTVTAINGSTLSVTQKVKPNASSTVGTMYTVNTASAKILKNGTTTTIGSITNGDAVMVQGTVSGTNILATVIRDGIGGTMQKGAMGNKNLHRNTTSTPRILPIQGNGQPLIGGSIASINGSTIIVTNISNVTYTVDAKSAKILKNGTTTTIVNLATGDEVVVQGAVNGTSVVAALIIDQGNAARVSSATPNEGSNLGLFGSIGIFFRHLFGF